LQEIVYRYKELVKRSTKADFPDDPSSQLRLSINAVFRSWMNDRAIHYRPDEQNLREPGGGDGRERSGHGL